MFTRRLFSLLAVALLTLVAVVPAAAADRVVHRTEEINLSFTFPAGPEAECFGRAEMITITFTGVVRTTEFVSGPNAGTFHERGRVAGTFRAFTGDTTLVTGTFKQNFNFKIHRGDERVNFVVHGTGTTPDGEQVKFQFHGHFTMRDGEITREIFKVNCIK